MEPAGRCQTRKLADADITSLCFSCKWRSGCGFALASEMIGEQAEPGVRRLHVIAECSDYTEVERTKDSDDPTYKSLRPALWKAGVRDLCCGCPSAAQGDCRTHGGLEALTARSRGNNQWIKAAVVCCTSTGERLYQISEPSGK